jgi:hypothetical protein
VTAGNLYAYLTFSLMAVNNELLKLEKDHKHTFASVFTNLCEPFFSNYKLGDGAKLFDYVL